MALSDFHTQAVAQLLVRRVTCQRSTSPVSSRKIWNPVHCCRHRHSGKPDRHQTVWCTWDRCAVACLGSFLYVRGCDSLDVCGRDRRCKTADADTMWTQNFRIHTPLATICRGNTISYAVSPNDKTHGPHVEALDSATHPCGGRRGQIYCYSSFLTN